MGVPFTFLHAADLHLDSPFKGLSKAPEAVRRRLRESTFAALERLVDTAVGEAVDFAVFSGDLFDAADRSLRAQLRLQRAMAELAANGIEVFIVHGNHDPLGGRQAKLDWPPGVHVFGAGEVACLPAHTRRGEVAAHVYGISYATSAVADNLALRFKIVEGAPFHIAVLHANVDGNPVYDNYAPCRLEELAAAGFQYWALGHVHDRRVLREYPHVVYPGNIQGRSVRETGGKGVYVVSVTERGSVDMRFRDIADVVWHEIPVSIAGLTREQELMDRLAACAEETRAGTRGRPSVVRFRLEGRGSLHDRLMDPAVIEGWLEALRERVGIPEDGDCWVWPASLSVRTGGELRLEAAAEESGFVGELLRSGLNAAGNPALARELADEAMDAMRRQPAIRQWLETRSAEERAAWIVQAMELSAALLKVEEAE